MGILTTAIESMRKWAGYGNSAGYGGVSSYLNLFDRVDDWGNVVGKCGPNSIESICQGYVARKFAEAPATVQLFNKAENTWVDAPHRPLQKLIDTPSPFFNGSQLMAVTAASLCRGNAYWVMVRSASGKPVELWWAPQINTGWGANYGMSPFVPVGDETGLPTCYLYNVNGRRYFVPLEDVIHFRLPLPVPGNPFVGADPLMAQRPYIAIDDEKGQYEYHSLVNQGIPGVVFSMKPNPNGGTTKLMPDAKETIRQEWQARVSGNKRGMAAIFDFPVDVTFPNVSPEHMALDIIGDTSEERIPAALGLNAMALGLGSGLKRSTYNNAQQSERAAFMNGVAVHHRNVTAGSAKLVMEMGNDPAGERLFFKYDDVPALQEDENELWKRLDEAFKAGTLKRSVSLSLRGIELKPDDPDGYVFDLQGQSPMLALMPPGAAGTIPDAGVSTDQTLNGAQITAAVDVITKLREGAISAITAVELLVAVGIPRDKAEAMVADTEGMPALPPPVAPAPTTKQSQALGAYMRDLLEKQSGTLALNAGGEYEWQPETRATKTAVGGLYDDEGRKRVQRFVEDLPAKAQAFYNQNDAAAQVGLTEVRVSVQEAMELGVKQAGATMANSALKLADEDITAAEFGTLMENSVIQLHGAQGVLGYGGLDRMTEERWGKLADKAQSKLDILEGFKKDIADGRYDDSDGGLAARTQLWANDGRCTYENTRMEASQEDYGHEWAQRIVAAVVHCDECEALGGEIVPIDEMVPLGECQCGANCACIVVTSKDRSDLE